MTNLNKLSTSTRNENITAYNAETTSNTSGGTTVAARNGHATLSPFLRPFSSTSGTSNSSWSRQTKRVVLVLLLALIPVPHLESHFLDVSLGGKGANTVTAALIPFLCPSRLNTDGDVPNDVNPHGSFLKRSLYYLQYT